MDPNFEFWRQNGQTFTSRFLIWMDLLDPLNLLASPTEIENARMKVQYSAMHHKKMTVDKAWSLSLTSVHADSGETIHSFLRPQAMVPLILPMVITSYFLPHNGVAGAIMWHFLLQKYFAEFNAANGNASVKPDEKSALVQKYAITGTVAYTAFVGVLPYSKFWTKQGFFISVQTFCRSVLPIPLSPLLAALNLLLVRNEETMVGIAVVDSKGNHVGLSKEAGTKAVRETAISRATLFGTALTVPNLLMFILKRGKLFQKYPLMVSPFTHITAVLVFGMMIPVSFSMFPQLGKIERQRIETNLQALTEDAELFYHRGL